MTKTVDKSFREESSESKIYGIKLWAKVFGEESSGSKI